jgi:hypothetical protein
MALAIEVAPASSISLPPRFNFVNVLFWLQIRHEHTLIIPHYQSIRKNRVAWRGNERLSKRTNRNVRKASTNTGRSCITNFVVSEIQFSQRRVLTVKNTQSKVDKACYQSDVHIRKIRVASKKCLYELICRKKFGRRRRNVFREKEVS